MNKHDFPDSSQDGVPDWFAPVVSGLVGLALVAGLGLRSAQKSLQAEKRVRSVPSAWAMDLKADSPSLELTQSDGPDLGAESTKRQS